MARVKIHYCPFCLTSIHALRVGVQIERSLNVSVERVKGRYGEYKVVADGDVAFDGGRKALLGILPSTKKVVAEVQKIVSAKSSVDEKIR